eukprot:TRINITY_DN2433_c0_g1_i1.p1 TRINITY_DN2433_c0_g1~~TRINITY_DN2433_c0_g1_i1.p1  ORF type:complete len:242 (-),score=95.85 TRINITY_DN2433_c0_g1_i1:52-777(-)
MSMAGRPTWSAAKGGAEQGGNRRIAPSMQYSNRDLASHTKMKVRQTGQNTTKEVAKRDLKRELEDKERKTASERGNKEILKIKEPIKEEEQKPQLLIKDVPDDDATKSRNYSLDADDSDSSSDEEDEKKSKDNESEGSSDDEDSDDEDELMRELEKIKKEREEERLKQASAKEEEESNRRAEAAMYGNPLLSQQDYSIKRKWYDDTVFKNQARDEPQLKKRFINDTTRNDFARKFLTKYIK